MQLDRPAPPGDRFVNEQNVGNLLVIDVLSTEYGVQTENGPADCVRANVYAIIPPGTVGAQYMGTLVFGKMLFSRLSQSVGRKVVGLLTGQPGVKVAGKNVPYDLDDPSDAMFEAASRAMTQLEMARPQAQQPATGWGAAQQQQQPPGWGQQAQQPAAAPWGQAPPQQQPPPGWGQQQIPAAEERPPWEQPPSDDPWATPAQQGPPPGWGRQ